MTLLSLFSFDNRNGKLWLIVSFSPLFFGVVRLQLLQEHEFNCSYQTRTECYVLVGSAFLHWGEGATCLPPLKKSFYSGRRIQRPLWTGVSWYKLLGAIYDFFTQPLRRLKRTADLCKRKGLLTFHKSLINLQTIHTQKFQLSSCLTSDDHKVD